MIGDTRTAGRIRRRAVAIVAFWIAVGACSGGSDRPEVGASATRATETTADLEPPIGTTLDAQTAATIAGVAGTAYGLETSEIMVVTADRSEVAAIFGEDVVGGLGESIIVAWGIGDLTNTLAHPPQGLDLPTGKTAYWIVDAKTNVIAGGGLLRADRDAELRSLGPAQSLAELGA